MSKIEENKYINIKLNNDLKGFKKNTILKILVDKEGNPLDNYWFRRLKDAKLDNCIEIIKDESSSTKRTTLKKEEINHDSHKA